MAEQWLSQNYFVGTGTRTTWEYSFAGARPDNPNGGPYLSTDDVRVALVDRDELGIETRTPVNFTHLGTNQVIISPAIEDGQEFVIYRETELTAPLVDYTDFAAVTERDLDTSYRQSLYTNQELRDYSRGSRALAEGARRDTAAALDVISEIVGSEDPLVELVRRGELTDPQNFSTLARVSTSSSPDQPIGEALNQRVIYVDSLADLQALPTSELVDGQQVSVKDVGLFSYETGDWRPQSVNVRSGPEFPDNPKENQLFIIEPDELYYYTGNQWQLLASDEHLQSFVDSASAQADRAETARDAAFVNADVYASTAAGLAATSNGEQFQVVDSSGNFLLRYVNNSGSASVVAAYPSAALIEGSGFPQAAFTTDFNAIEASGVYRAPDGGAVAAGSPEPLARILVFHIEGFQGRARQTAYRAESGEGDKIWTRTRDSESEWTEWISILTDSDVGEYQPQAAFTTDFNDIHTSGFYRAPDGGAVAEGSPEPLARILVEHIEGFQGRARQTAYRAVGGEGDKIWTRTRDSEGEWTEWKTILTDTAVGEYQPAAPFVHNWDEVERSGIYRSNSSGQAPIGGPGNIAHMALEHIEGFDGRAYQTARQVGSPHRVWTRVRSSSGEWSEWALHATDNVKSLSDASVSNFYLDAESLKRSLPEASNWSASRSTYFTDSDQLNGLYQQLESEFPDYVSSELLGEDDFGNDIWEFTFTPPGFRWIAPATPTQNAHPKIVIVAGMHGSEPLAMLVAYLFANELCNNWQRDEALSELRWGCEIVIVPCLCPSGLNAGTRRNGNNVDINHNFPTGWDELVSDYKGTAPLDQPESIIARNLAVRHPTAKTFIDFHAHENDYSTWIGTRSEHGYAIQKHMLRRHQAWMYRNMMSDRTENTALVASTGTTLTGLATDWTYTYDKKGFLLEMHVNWPTTNRRNGRRVGFDALLKLIYENWRVESESTGWLGSPPTA